MRTTLKRGVGRAATVNGNGRSVLPPGAVEPTPPLPAAGAAAAVDRPACRTGVRLDVARAPRHRRRDSEAGSTSTGHQTLNAIAPRTPGLNAATRLLTKVPPPSQPATALLIGYDARAGVDGFGASGSRSDTVMLIRADPTS